MPSVIPIGITKFVIGQDPKVMLSFAWKIKQLLCSYTTASMAFVKVITVLIVHTIYRRKTGNNPID